MYVDPIGLGVLWPSRTHLAFQVRSIFTSQTWWPVTFDHPAGALCPCSRTSSAILMLDIYFARASFHIGSPFFQSSSIAWETSLSISMPYLRVVFLSLVLIANKITSCLQSMYRTSHAKATLSSMPLACANSSILTVWDSFISASVAHDSVQSHHLMSNFHPDVVDLSLLWLLIIAMICLPFEQELSCSWNT